MPIINFDYPAASGNKYDKEAINTDFLQRAYYNPYGSDGQPSIHLTFLGEVKKLYVGAVATDIYRYVQAQPTFIETKDGAHTKATKLLNMNYAVRIFYRDKANSTDNESSITIEYGLSKEIADREPKEPGRGAGGPDVTSGSWVVIRGDEADAVWSKFQGTAL